MAIDGGIFIDILTRLNSASVDRVLKDVKTIMKEAGTDCGDGFMTTFDSTISDGARTAFDPLVQASNAAFRDMQIAMAQMQTAEADINNLRAQGYEDMTQRMIDAQARLDAAIANSQRMMSEAQAQNAAYRDSIAIPAGLPGSEGGGDRSSDPYASENRVATGASSRTSAAEMGGAYAAGDYVGTREAQGGGTPVVDRAQDALKDVVGDRFTHHLESGSGAGMRVAGLASALGLAGMAGYGVRAESRIQQNIVPLAALQGDTNVGMYTPAIWDQATRTGYNTNDISKLYPAIEQATNPVTGARYRGNDTISIANTALELARVSGIDPKDALQGLTTTLYNYKKTPDQATGMANMIAQGLAGFKGNAADYFEAQHTIEPVAEQAGIGPGEVFGGLDIMSQTGQTAQQSADSFRNLIKSLARPNSMVSAGLQQLGLNPQDMSVYLSQNGIGKSLSEVLQGITKDQFGPNGSVVLGAMANKPLMEQQQGLIAEQMSPEMQKYIATDEFQKSLVSGFSARKILDKAGSQNFAKTDMPLLQTWLADQQKIQGTSDVLRRNQPMEESLYAAFTQAFGTQDAAQAAIMMGGSPEALAAYQKQAGNLQNAGNNPNAFMDSFKKAMDTNVQQWHVLGQNLGQVSAHLGDDLLPTLKTVTEGFSGVLNFLDQHKRVEGDLIDAMVGLTAYYIGLKANKALGNPLGGLYNLSKKGVNAFRNRGEGDTQHIPVSNAEEGGTLQTAAETLQTASETLQPAVETFGTSTGTFETAVTAFAEAAPIFGEAAPIFGEAVPIFSEAATAFSTAVAPFETAATTMDTAATTMDAAATQLETAATSLDGAATALDTAASAQDLNPAAVPPGAPGAPGEGGGSVGRALGAVAIPLGVADAISGHNTPQEIWNALHGKQENGKPMPYIAPGPPTPTTGPGADIAGRGGLADLANIPVSQGGLKPDAPGRAHGGMIPHFSVGGVPGQPLMGVPDKGYDTVLGMLPDGQPVGLRGGEGILTPETVAALGGPQAVNALNAQGKLGSNYNPWDNPTRVGVDLYSSFAKGVQKYSPFGKYLTATSQSLSDLEKEQENAAKLQAQADKIIADDTLSQLGFDMYQGIPKGRRPLIPTADGVSPSYRTYTDGTRKYGGSGHVTPGSPGVMAAIRNAAAAAGLSQSELNDVDWIFSHESGFDPTISNGGGHGAPSNNKAYGLGQFLGHMGDKYGAMGAYSGDPGQEAAAAIQYMKDRYGGPAGAKQYWEAHGNYAHGGVVGYATGGIVGGGGGSVYPWPVNPGFLGTPGVTNDYSLPNGDTDSPLTSNIGPYLNGAIGPRGMPDVYGAPYAGPFGTLPKGWNFDYRYSNGNGNSTDFTNLFDPKFGGDNNNVVLAPHDSNGWGYPVGKGAGGNPITQKNGNPLYGFDQGGVVPAGNGTGPAPGPAPGAKGSAGLPQDHGSNQMPAGAPRTLDYGKGDAPNTLPGMTSGKASKPNAPLHDPYLRDSSTSGLGDLSNWLIPGGTSPNGDRNIKSNPSRQLTAEGSGFGVGGGGVLGMAESAGAMAANAFAPGSGQAAQGAFNLANRAVGYVGQLFGIGIEGLMETFLPNDSQEGDPSKNIFGKIALGIAGAHPSGQNLAGSHAKQLQPKKDLDAGAAQGKQNPTIHVDTINNHTADHQETFNAMNKAVNFSNQAGWFPGT